LEIVSGAAAAGAVSASSDIVRPCRAASRLSSNTGFACLRCKNARQKFILLQAGACEYALFNDGEMSGPIGPFNNPGSRLVPTSATGGIGNRSNTMPEDAGRPARQASSPKSLSQYGQFRPWFELGSPPQYYPICWNRQ
jgi:hypothetical protein